MRSISAELRRLRKLGLLTLASRRRPQSAAAAAASVTDASSSAIFKEYFVVIAALVYFMGWMFLYYYLFDFGIDIFAVDLPFYYFFVYAFAVIRHALVSPSWAGAGALAAIVALLIASRWIGLALKDGRAPSFLAILPPNLLGTVAVAIAFVAGHQAAYGAATARAEAIRFDPVIEAQFHFRESPGFLRSLFPSKESPSLSALATMTLDRTVTVILETTNRYFVLVQPLAIGDGADYRRAARVIELSRDDVKFTEFRLPNMKRQ